jgi:hypothetical protein
MNKATIGLIGLAAIATSCEKPNKIEIEGFPDFILDKSSRFDGHKYEGDSILKFPNIKMFRNDCAPVYKIVIDKVSYDRENFYWTPITPEDSLFLAADSIWYICDSLAKRHKFEGKNDAIRKATSRVYNVLDFVEK